jgi:two-component system invasion response regulator UvrY
MGGPVRAAPAAIGARACSFPRRAFRANVAHAQPHAAPRVIPAESSTPMSIRILIADDHAIVRAGLQQFIADEPDLEVVGEAGTGTEALAFIRSQGCDVVLLDIAMPGLNGVDALQQIRRVKPDLPVLILTAYPEEQYAVSLLRAGASGFIRKESASDQLIAAIRTVAQGSKYVSPSLGQLLLKDLEGSDRPPHAALSEREFQIFRRLASGQSVSRIAEDLFLSVKTVSTYRTRILEKMDMRTNADLTYYAIKNGLIE